MKKHMGKRILAGYLAMLLLFGDATGAWAVEISGLAENAEFMLRETAWIISSVSTEHPNMSFLKRFITQDKKEIS